MISVQLVRRSEMGGKQMGVEQESIAMKVTLKSSLPKLGLLFFLRSCSPPFE